MDVTVADISNLIQLVREVCDRWDEPRAWREYLLHGACQLIDGNVGSMHAVEIKENYHEVQTLAVVGLPSELAAMIYSSTEEMVTGLRRGGSDRERDADGGKTFRCVRSQRLGHCLADELVDLKTFHASAMYIKFRKPLDCDDQVVSVRAVDIPQCAEMIDVDRPHGATPFGPREVTLLKLLHDEIAPLVGVRLATEAHLSRDGLSRRLNDTLTLLLDGCSEKEVATQLGLGSRTVHDYVTMIYRHFAVASRGAIGVLYPPPSDASIITSSRSSAGATLFLPLPSSQLPFALLLQLGFS